MTPILLLMELVVRIFGPSGTFLRQRADIMRICSPNNGYCLTTSMNSERGRLRSSTKPLAAAEAARTLVSTRSASSPKNAPVWARFSNFPSDLGSTWPSNLTSSSMSQAMPLFPGSNSTISPLTMKYIAWPMSCLLKSTSNGTRMRKLCEMTLTSVTTQSGGQLLKMSHPLISFLWMHRSSFKRSDGERSANKPPSFSECTEANKYW
mmetsp:Transcript_35530/g.80312  ORF Transcript_35530/g.80312 Transcript_35530/m.80312 type:complete len:207 (+) Transcript_35530:115-735(+)